MLRGCVDIALPCQIQDPLSRPVMSQRYSRRSVVYAIRYPSDIRCIRVLNSALVGCARCALGFRFPKKYAHQNDPLNQGNLHELKLRLKIVRYPGIEVGLAGDSGKKPAHSICQKFAGPTIRIMRHLPMSFLERRIQRTVEEKTNRSHLPLKSVLCFELFSF